MSKIDIEAARKFSPFHNAVGFYEEKKSKEALPLFLLLSERGNLAAHFYLRDLLTTENPPQKAQILKELMERLSCTPKNSNADDWLKASKLIQSLNDTNQKIKPKVRKNLLAQLASLLPLAGNAALFFLEHESLAQDKVLTEKVMTCCDLSLLCHLKSNAKLPSFLEGEWAIIEKFSSLASAGKESQIPSQLGLLEAMLYRTTQAKTRKSIWLKQAAIFGFKDLQLFYALPGNEEQNQWLECAAISGHIEAQMKLALNHFKGDDGFKIDKTKTKKYLDIIINNPEAKKNVNLHFECMSIMGALYEAGEGGLPQNEATAFQYFSQAATYAEKNKLDEKRIVILVQLLFKLGYFYENGLGNLVRNYKIAADYYEHALKTVDNQRVKNIIHKKLFSLYQEGGFQLNKDDKIALSHLVAAAFKGDFGAAMKLFIRFFVNKEKDLTLEQLEALLLLHNPKDPRVLTYSGMYYLKYAVPIDNRKAFSFFLQAATDKRGVETDAMIMLAQMHNDNLPELPVKASPKIAYEYLKQAAELKNPIALNNMGNALVKGLGVPRDFVTAKKCFEESLALGFKYASSNLANLYHHGLGVEKDFQKAFEYLLAAEACQEPGIFFCLGLYYQMGLIGKRDLTKALYYHEKAVILGDPRAAHNYARIRLFQILMDNNAITSDLEDIQKKLKLTLLLDFNANENTSLYCLVMLLISPDSRKESIELLKAQLQKAPAKLSSLLLAHLENSMYISEDYLITLLACNLLDTLPDAEYPTILPEEDKIVAETLNSAPAQIVPPSSPAAKTETLPRAKITPQSTRKERLTRKLSQFFDSKNKDVNLRTFNQILATMVNTFDISYEVKSSKGSNVNYRLEHPSFSQPLCFSYHPTHSRGKCFDAEFDPKRANSLRSFIKNVASELQMDVKK
jgi:TPR repeat protein